ncbi:hypothetical protein I6F14_16825 [Bradyrhizobium sp. IC3069]|uniref:hypothetical protein n=1 Tax=Bradyrhizobium yuanmingense TaxID=108015 RepID=UPI00056B2B77|nr:hypothetical protein [Bradyrhizobium sp. CB1024]MCA1375735.1 hypothetical protein [Bradyrhizobium sp. IC4060]MCA1485669.1 hypothetical protein [Bradyrhizobium sp. IC4061]MCA1519654.1 hypothetical protein [Bradyrhizobium sp. IC3069]UWU88673.1 hypothetical protein N2605_20680 [Bradyrhizobium sp. CB1024]
MGSASGCGDSGAACAAVAAKAAAPAVNPKASFKKFRRSIVSSFLDHRARDAEGMSLQRHEPKLKPAFRFMRAEMKNS